MYFGSAQLQLLDLVRGHVRSGHLTERRLARLAGVSQPHLHNILKGIRTLSPELGDQLLRNLGLTLFDLCTATQPVDIPDVRRKTLQSLPLSRLIAAKDPDLLILGCDTVMQPRFQKGDSVLLDRSDITRSNPDPHAFYAVDLPGGTGARYVRLGGRCLYLATDATLREPSEWEYVSLASRNILEVVKGRIIWIGREMQA